MPGVELGSAHVEIRATQDQLKKDLDSAEGTVKASLDKLATVAAGAGAALTSAVAGATVAAFKLGETFDSAFDTIRAGTGKTGSDLEGLKNDFRAVVADVPADFDKASEVVAELNKRTGATGATLQGLAKNVLEFSRITGTDAVGNVQLATRMFGDWSIASEDQGAALDKVFRASQATGIGVDALMGKVVQFGAPLRAMGFSMEESAAMMGKWEKEGVNTELVLGSMRIAMGKFADAGVPAREGLDATIAKINELGPSAEATSLAMDVFGARAGPDMAAAILEGRFALGDLFDQVANGSETIQGVAADTADGAERMKLAMNRVALAFEPVGSAVFGLQAALIQKFAPALETTLAAAAPMIAAFADGLEPALDAVFEGFKTVLDVLTPVVSFIGDNLMPIVAAATAAFAAWAIPILTVLVPAFVTWASTAAVAAASTALALAPVVLPLVAIGAAAALLAKAWEGNWGDIQGKVEAVWDVVRPILESVFGELARFWEEIQPEITKAWDAISTKVSTAITAVWDFIKPVIDKLVLFWTENWTTIQTVFGTVWDVMTLGVRVAWELVQGVVTAGLKLLQGDWQGAWDAMASALGSVWEEIRGTAGRAWSLIVQAIATAFSAVGNAIQGTINDLLSRLRPITDAIGRIFDFINNPPSLPEIKLPALPHFASGVTNFGGGMAVVGENGPELVNLPTGADVIPMGGAFGGMSLSGGGGGLDGMGGDVIMDGERVGRIVWRFLKGQRTAGATLGLT